MSRQMLIPEKHKKWDFWVDRGGTFTDIIASNPDHQVFTRKLLSENPEVYEDATLQGIRDFLQLESDQALPQELIGSVKMGTTVATNALLERKGEPTVLLITAGLRDVLEIGYQVRPKTFALEIKKPELLYSHIIEVEERLNHQGEVLIELDESRLRSNLQQAYEQGYRSAAIALMHGYRFISHEERVAQIAREIGFDQISVSHDVSATIRIVPRGDTTVVDAYLSPILHRYVERVAQAIGADQDEIQLLFMRSSGGMAQASQFHGRDAILSGPAGGIIAAAHTSNIAGFEKIIGFDMGGTSTDVSHYAGHFERAYETEVAGVRMSVPMMSVCTVAAGGGSLLHYDQLRFRVGPESAGANPGPLCYRRGGPLTVTDANVCLGKINPDYFPALFGPDQNQSIDLDGVRTAFKQLPSASEDNSKPEQIAEGFVRIAVEHMAQAIKKISIERGHDVQQYALSCFGGAGGQHACLVAERLGMSTIVIHPYASMLSAYGMGLADIRTQKTISFREPLTSGTTEKLTSTVENLQAGTAKEMLQQHVSHEQQTHLTTLFLRYSGTDTTLPVDYDSIEIMQDNFESAHQTLYGFTTPEKEIMIESINVETFGGGQKITEPVFEPADTNTVETNSTTRIFSGDAWLECSVYQLEQLKPGHEINGPAMIVETNGTIIVEPGWQAHMNQHRHLLLTQTDRTNMQTRVSTRRDPVLLEIFNNQFMSIAEQMGIVLKNTSSSVNIKERLDFSCAIFDQQGDLIANAPHIPVHLGSMDATIKVLIESGLSIEPGDAFIHNDPFNGGSHLPDVTVITPVFDDSEQQINFYVASRAHHADIGGIAPGSMSPTATSIEEEGILIPCTKLVSKGRFLEQELSDILTNSPYPVRNLPQNIADLKAQIGANQKGQIELTKLINEYGNQIVAAYTGHIQDNAEESVQRVIRDLHDCDFEYRMDDGLKICVRISIDKNAGTANVDFSGSSEQQESNFNAPAAITRAVVLYVFRCLIDNDIPLNAGCMRPITLIIPDGSMLKPEYPAAVVAGNVEVSQAIANALFGALGVLGSTQGTMNNLTFGNDQHQYYETICSGAAAGPDFDGANAVHTHMTNSRLTDPEILESRFPVLLKEFEIMRGSGGKGRHCAGDGVRRKIEFQQAMHCAILSGHRKVAPFGSNGGAEGRPGKNWIERPDKTNLDLGGCGEAEVVPGDAVIIETPTGGGFGKAVS